MVVRYIIFLLVFLIITGCAAPLMDMAEPKPEKTQEPIPKDNNPIFPGTKKIESALPDDNDTVSLPIQFTWTATGADLVYLGIFNQKIDMALGKIKNINDNIWAWHSGLGQGREGSVVFSDGFDVVDGKMETTHSPTPLENGKTYYWAVWCWDKNGITITASSEERYFNVPPL